MIIPHCSPSFLAANISTSLCHSTHNISQLRFSSVLSISHIQNSSTTSLLTANFGFFPVCMSKMPPRFASSCTSPTAVSSPLWFGFPIRCVPSKALSKCYKLSITQHSQETPESCSPILHIPLQLLLDTSLLPVIKDFIAPFNDLIVSPQLWIRARVKIQSQVS